MEIWIIYFTVSVLVIYYLGKRFSYFSLDLGRLDSSLDYENKIKSLQLSHISSIEKYKSRIIDLTSLHDQIILESSSSILFLKSRLSFLETYSDDLNKDLILYYNEYGELDGVITEVVSVSSSDFIDKSNSTISSSIDKIISDSRISYLHTQLKGLIGDRYNKNASLEELEVIYSLYID